MEIKIAVSDPNHSRRCRVPRRHDQKRQCPQGGNCRRWPQNRLRERGLIGKTCRLAKSACAVWELSELAPLSLPRSGRHPCQYRSPCPRRLVPCVVRHWRGSASRDQRFRRRSRASAIELTRGWLAIVAMNAVEDLQVAAGAKRDDDAAAN